MVFDYWSTRKIYVSPYHCSQLDLTVGNKEAKAKSDVAQSCRTLCDPMDCSLPGSLSPWNFPGKSTGVGCHFLLQEIFLTRDWTQVSRVAGRQFTIWATRIIYKSDWITFPEFNSASTGNLSSLNPLASGKPCGCQRSHKKSSAHYSTAVVSGAEGRQRACPLGRRWIGCFTNIKELHFVSCWADHYTFSPAASQSFSFYTVLFAVVNIKIVFSLKNPANNF